MTLGLEDVAEALRSRLGIHDGFGDAEGVAAACGLVMCPSDVPFGHLDGDTIYYPRSAAPEERQRHVARELGRWALIDAGLPETDERARLVGLLLTDGPSLVRRESGVMIVAV